MRDAVVEKERVEAGPGAPQNARCPVCGGWVTLRRRRVRGGKTSWFYRHVEGEGRRCSRRAGADWIG